MRIQNDWLRLRHILDAIEKIEGYAAGFDLAKFRNDEKTQDAILRQLSIVGEAIANISAKLKERHSHVEWREATRTRNRIIHGYFDVDTAVVWDTVESDLPILKGEVADIFAELNENDSTE